MMRNMSLFPPSSEGDGSNIEPTIRAGIFDLQRQNPYQRIIRWIYGGQTFRYKLGPYTLT